MAAPMPFLSRVVRSPIVWGTVAAVAFYLPIETDVWQAPYVDRYFTGHPVAYAAMVLFFIGLATLVFKCLDVVEQWPLMRKRLLPVPRAQGESVETCVPLLAALDNLAPAVQRSWLATRLHDALDVVRRKGSADTLDEELKYLAESDAARLYGTYALMRIIIWAIPILGFLGTVMGITLAIANLSPQALEKSLPEVTYGLGVAFDTTALALALSMLLMFGQFLTDRAEQRLLAAVDNCVVAELGGRFEQTGTSTDPQLVAVRRMADAVVNATERLVQRQSELWQATIDAAHQHWSKLATGSQQQVEAALTTALSRSLQSFAVDLSEASQSAAAKSQEHWSQVQAALVETAQASREQQAELGRQSEVLLRVVEATGQVAKLEETLNSNLAALTGAQTFEETLLNLSAAIQLLGARLNHAQRPAQTVSLSGNRVETHAA
ncbi:MAG: MotA/TolQ/ExbB proton channel family protein [Pirellulales bacterium]